MSLLERIYFFHNRLQTKQYPNATTLIEHFEISLATARRDIAYLRDRLLAPMSFDSAKNGFYYLHDDFDLPFSQSPKIIFLLGMLNKMAEEAGLGQLEEVKQLEKRLSELVFPDYGKLVESIFCEWVEIESLSPLIFEKILEALVTSRLLRVSYRSPQGEETERDLAPHRLINYQGRWYLLAFCQLRRAKRLFHTSRIHQATLLSERFEKSSYDFDAFLRKSFGIFKGETTYWAKILFTSTAAELVRHQHWHREQTLENTEDGILLHLPVSDDRELMMKVLQYGAMAQVISPESLRKRVQEEIVQMSENYS